MVVCVYKQDIYHLLNVVTLRGIWRLIDRSVSVGATGAFAMWLFVK